MVFDRKNKRYEYEPEGKKGLLDRMKESTGSAYNQAKETSGKLYTGFKEKREKRLAEEATPEHWEKKARILKAKHEIKTYSPKFDFSNAIGNPFIETNIPRHGKTKYSKRSKRKKIKNDFFTI
jgi:hypothetical protein